MFIYPFLNSSNVFALVSRAPALPIFSVTFDCRISSTKSTFWYIRSYHTSISLGLIELLMLETMPSTCFKLKFNLHCQVAQMTFDTLATQPHIPTAAVTPVKIISTPYPDS